ncbi:MAG TPA: hypothetical protein VKV16_01840 [Solirubrobacteraceae bacterium]|nr:hypothetical protein [Solirubrobacteraceae bacterium]
MRLAAVAFVAGLSLFAVPLAGGATSATTCGYIHASVPYTAHGSAHRWRVYVTGAASCAAATKALDAIMHLQGHQHVGRSEAGSYTLYDGWVCPFGGMGVQSCELPTRPPAHPPIKARALARDCSVPRQGCPAVLPASDI